LDFELEQMKIMSSWVCDFFEKWKTFLIPFAMRLSEFIVVKLCCSWLNDYLVTRQDLWAFRKLLTFNI
jgi:hypothetical protein